MNFHAIAQAGNLNELVEALRASVTGFLPGVETFVVLTDRQTGRPEVASLPVASDARSDVVRDGAEDTGRGRLPCWNWDGDPRVFEKLVQGHDVMIPHAPEGEGGPAAIDPAGRARARTPAGRDAASGRFSRLLVLPVRYRAGLEALLCVAVPEGGEAPAAGEMDSLRQLCEQAGPFVAAMREVEALRQRNAQLLELLGAGPESASALAELRREKGQLEAVLEIKRHLVSNLVHELRSPLVALRGYARLLSDGRAGPLNPTQQRYVGVISENTGRLVTLVNSLLKFANSQPLQLQPFDLRAVAEEAIERIAGLAAEKPVRVVRTIPSEPFFVTADKLKLAQVFDQLLGNALRYTDAGGQIAVQLQRGEADVTVRVSDTGVGMPPGLLERVFDRYAQADAPDGQDGDPAAGDGVGLSRVRDIIRLHGGRISVASRLGQGSSFVFVLPAVRGASASASAGDQASDGASEREKTSSGASESAREVEGAPGG